MPEDVFERGKELMVESSEYPLILGGEPTLHPLFNRYVLNLFDAVEEGGGFVEIASNGSFIYDVNRRSKVAEVLKTAATNTKNKTVHLSVSGDRYHMRFWKSPEHIGLIRQWLTDSGLSGLPQLTFGVNSRADNGVNPVGRAKRNYLPGGFVSEIMGKASCVMSHMQDEDDDDISDAYDEFLIFPDGQFSTCRHALVKIGNIMELDNAGVRDRIRSFAEAARSRQPQCGKCAHTFADFRTNSNCRLKLAA
jgi:hypothetical protein